MGRLAEGKGCIRACALFACACICVRVHVCAHACACVQRGLECAGQGPQGSGCDGPEGSGRAVGSPPAHPQGRILLSLFLCLFLCNSRGRLLISFYFFSVLHVNQEMASAILVDPLPALPCSTTGR